MKDRHPSVLVLHHAVAASNSSSTAASDAGVMDEVQSVVAALQQLGMPHRIASVARLQDLPPLLQAASEPIVFNLVENFPDGRTDHAMQVPTLCEAFGKVCTGNDSSSQTLCLNKWRTKGVLRAAGLPVPEGIVVLPGTCLTYALLPPKPWIVKPLSADASEGIHAGSVVSEDLRALNRAIAKVHKSFHQPALVESFFGCRELNVAILQKGGRLKALPVSEIEFRNYSGNRPKVVDYKAKWAPESFEYRNTVRVVPASISPALSRRIVRSALKAWHALGCRDYARIDFRLDDGGDFVILEANPNPDIAPESGFAASLTAAGLEFRQFVRCVVHNAMSRLPAHDRSCRRSLCSLSSRKEGVSIRRTESCDRDSILGFMRDTGFFHPGEIDVAREVLDDAIKGGASGHYQSFCLCEGVIPVGWICFGPTPCTVGTYDIYWIGVCPKHQGMGYGRALLEYSERIMRKSKGRMAIIETSGRAGYDATRGFYLANGYREIARVPDFYAMDDARVIYTKPLVFS